MIHVAWTVADKVRVQDMRKAMKEMLPSVHYFGEDHPLPTAVREAVKAIGKVEDELDNAFSPRS